MSIRTRLQQSSVLGLVLALALVLGLTTFIFRGEQSDQRLQHRQRLAVLQANALATAVADLPAEEVQARVVAVKAATPELESVLIVGGMQLLASTKIDDQAPRQLKREEKALFDLSNLIRTARETNASEEVVRKKIVQVEERTPGHMTVTVPYLDHGKFAGILQVRFNASGADSANRSTDSFELPLTLLVIALILGPFLGLHADRTVEFSKIFTVGVLLALAMFYQHERLDLLSQGAERVNQSVASSYRQVVERLDKVGYTFERQSMGSVSPWDTDHYQRPLGMIASDGNVLAAAQISNFESRTKFLQRSLWLVNLLGLGVLLFFMYGFAARTLAALKEHATAYAYVAPAMVGMLVLVFFPFAYGISLAFTDTTLFNEFLPFSERWVGWANFKAILGDFNVAEQTPDGLVWHYQNFYWTLLMTVIWTISNVAIGLSLGFVLAMALNTENLRGKTIYRVLLILPWAIPNYITALVWRGMFHPQFGVINQFLQMFGLQPVAWFDGVVSSFVTGLATNGWLSFPFMMVVILGALQSIPKDMYEAAEVEGANGWQRLRHITLPLLKPTLVPAIVLSVVWTFNMFNIIFLVSGGEPGGANEILITKAYKIAFENYQYAYAAAYSTVIFIILLVYGFFQTKVTKATESY
jgi:arabinogalactan oligomer/maltooligosaccharide transport system permease protein